MTSRNRPHKLAARTLILVGAGIGVAGVASASGGAPLFGMPAHVEKAPKSRPEKAPLYGMPARPVSHKVKGGGIPLYGLPALPGKTKGKSGGTHILFGLSVNPDPK